MEKSYQIFLTKNPKSIKFKSQISFDPLVSQSPCHTQI